MQFLLFLISPILSLPTIFSGIKHGKKSSLVLLALFMGLFAYCTMPAQDLFRHFEHYEHFASLNLKDITELDFSLNGIEVYIFCLMGKIGLHFDYFRLFTLSIGFYLLCDIFYWKMRNTSVVYSNTEYFARFIIFLLFFDLFYTVMGLRYGFALCLYLYGVFKMIDKDEKKKALVFFVLAYLFHTSFLFLVGASLALYYLRISKSNMVLLVILAFAAMRYFFAHYSDMLGVRADWYGSSSRVSDYSNMTTWGLIGFVGPKLCALPFAFLMFKNNIQDSKWGRMAMAWFVLSLICLSNAVFLYRIWWGFTAIGVYLLIDLEKVHGKFDLNVIKRIKYAGILFLLFNIIPHHSMFTRSDYYRLFEPVPIILMENYDINEILKKYPSIGDFV